MEFYDINGILLKVGDIATYKNVTERVYDEASDGRFYPEDYDEPDFEGRKVKIIKFDGYDGTILVEDIRARSCLWTYGCYLTKENKETRKEKIEESFNKKEDNKKEESGLKMDMKKIFGTGIGDLEDKVALTYLGQIAVKKEDGSYITYNKSNGTLENQMDMVMSMQGFLIAIPTPTVAIDDIIVKDDNFYQVLKINENGSLNSIDFKTGQEVTILKETTFGMSYYIKVFNMLGQMNQGQQQNPMMGTIMMQMMMGKDKDMDIKDLMMMQMMMGQNGVFQLFTDNSQDK